MEVSTIGSWEQHVAARSDRRNSQHSTSSVSTVSFLHDKRGMFVTKSLPISIQSCFRPAA
jgi:hypothetical protein